MRTIIFNNLERIDTIFTKSIYLIVFTFILVSAHTIVLSEISKDLSINKYIFYLVELAIVPIFLFIILKGYTLFKFEFFSIFKSAFLREGDIVSLRTNDERKNYTGEILSLASLDKNDPVILGLSEKVIFKDNLLTKLQRVRATVNLGAGLYAKVPFDCILTINSSN